MTMIAYLARKKKYAVLLNKKVPLYKSTNTPLKRMLI